MEINEFSILPLKDKEEYLKEHGKYIVTRDYYNQRVDLYSLQNYFVEICYHIMDSKESHYDDNIKFALIKKIETLEDDKGLDIYIELYKRNNYKVF